MLIADHLNIDGPPFPVKCVRKFRSTLGEEVTYRGVFMCMSRNVSMNTTMSVAIRSSLRPSESIKVSMIIRLNVESSGL